MCFDFCNHLIGWSISKFTEYQVKSNHSQLYWNINDNIDHKQRVSKQYNNILHSLTYMNIWTYIWNLILFASWHLYSTKTVFHFSYIMYDKKIMYYLHKIGGFKNLGCESRKWQFAQNPLEKKEKKIATETRYFS